MTNKNTNARIYVVYVALVAFALAILVKLFIIQINEGDHWKAKNFALATEYKNIEATRGNIYSYDGKLICSSIPIYDIRMDFRSEALTDKIFNENVEPLARAYANLFKDKSWREYLRLLKRGRTEGNRYKLIKKNISYGQLQEVKKFPLYEKGRFRGGVIYIKKTKRSKPFNRLASRTIGLNRENASVGLERAYDETLKGSKGKRLERRLPGGVWIPVGEENKIDPKDGSDIYSTLDIEIQDVAENALEEQLKLQQADHGCVVVMEVKTGKIRAISNLARNKYGRYEETYNYAVGESTEPGSTFKLPALMAALEEGKVSINDSVNTEDGTKKFYDITVKDSNGKGYGKITVKRAFEVSSNVAMSKVINESFAKAPKQFTDRLKKMHLHEKLGVEIVGEGQPLIKDPSANSWSGVSLPMMAFGYEVLQTPLQILTFYNAIANNGKMVKPQFIERVQRSGKIVKEIEPQVIDKKICSDKTLAQVKTMLEGVVENGTAANLNGHSLKIAGKTGTTQIANKNYGYKYNSELSYQASFVGYFPAENPQYSCIVVVNSPSKSNDYYGNVVAGPIFREIADKVYSTKLDVHQPVSETGTYLTALPYSKNGHQEKLKTVFKTLKIPLKESSPQSKWTATITGTENVELAHRKITERTVPNVVGMGLQDAIFILENRGLAVNFNGRGTVKNQSVLPGGKIVLKLSMSN